MSKDPKPESIQILTDRHKVHGFFNPSSAYAASGAGFINGIPRVYALLYQCITNSVPEFVFNQGRVSVKEAVTGNELADLRT